MRLTTEVLPTGQYGWVHDLRQVADGTAAGAVALAKSAGLRGLLVKYNDGSSVVAGDGSGQQWQVQSRALVPACAAVGLLVIPWGYVYPTDREPFAALAQQALADTTPANPDGFYVLDAEIEFDDDSNAESDAQAMLAAVKAAVPSVRLLYTSWGVPDQHPAFPWSAFNTACQAFLPQIYPGLIGWDATTCYNRAFLGGSGGGPGIEQMQPVPAVVPTFDLSDIGTCAALAKNGGFPAVTWWVMDGMTAAQAQALAGTSYAMTTQPAPTSASSSLSQQVAALEAQVAALQAANAALQRKIAAAKTVLES
jgi:hypothetical protein